ncbi:excinuclease ABC subunit UvrC [Crocinitomicaceae bacterium]|nr:excinuclease ABC subunit UvrC [Crocinitomicaceae bacterium]MDG1036426.1 excinuclease ABC subunit UvrC [Crocinitomicaceae bacterium]
MSTEKEFIRLKLKVLPNKPGVYQYYDKSGTIIYVGKAKDLKKRVASYFNKKLDSGKTRVLVRQIEDIKYIVVDTELDALLLENNLIKKYQPKYNIQLKDDKTYPWICIKKEPFPRVFTTRRMIKDGSKYFGPYPSVKVVNTLLELIRDVYALRTCALDLSEKKIKEGKHKVCLEYHIGNCKGPCIGEETAEDYNQYIKDIEHIVKGNLGAVIQSLKLLMQERSAQLQFEEAQKIKAKITVIERYKAKSTVVSPTIHQVDVITMVQDSKSAFVNYLVINNGAIIHGYTVEVKKKLDESPSSIIGYVLPELRDRFKSLSKEILVEDALDLSLDGVQFFTPQRGDKKSLIDLSLRNAKFYKLEKAKQEKIKNPERHTERILEQIRIDFRLTDLPVHIECFDNSNFHGTNAVAACVVFKNAKPSKKDYRHFNIKTVEGADDFASMEEVVFRRYKRLLEEGAPLPQLIVIDGGKGQLSSSLKALEKLGLRGEIAIVGIAKKLEELFFPGDSIPIYIDKRSESIRVIQYLRNEAHRFGIAHHRNKRSKGALVSELTEIKGVGEKTYEQLIQTFKSIGGVQRASLEELTAAVGSAKAKIIRAHFEG